MRRSLALLALSLASAPLSTAHACGGFFCSSAPVDQSKEVIVYAYEDDGTLTMAVQVSYQGRDEEFAWILPVPVPPDEIGVGADVLFDALHAATTPQFALESRTDGACAATPVCEFPSYGGGCSFGCFAADGAPAPRGGIDAASFADSGPGGVTVYSESIVGPYDTVVLGASTATEVIEWLQTNGYDVPSESEPLLEPYAAQGHVFIALRLTANRASDVLRPIVLHMPTHEACLPIRLTAIATTPTLPIEAIFLGDAQARSTNYSTADVELVPGLFTNGTTWNAEVAARVQELGGQAFATDYAGSTPEVSLTLPNVTDLAREPDPARFLRELSSRGYTASALLLDLFQRYVVPPLGADPTSYYNCLFSGSTAACGEPTRFDAAGLASRIDAEITVPRRDAQALVERHAYTTRLSTTLRAEHMTLDPVFVRDGSLPDVPLMRVGTLVTECTSDYYLETAPQHLELGDARYPWREGSEVTPERYCHDRGGTLRAEPSGGCSSSRGGLPTPGLLLLVGLGAALLYRRLRR